jgi:hypothetical protein
MASAEPSPLSGASSPGDRDRRLRPAPRYRVSAGAARPQSHRRRIRTRHRHPAGLRDVPGLVWLDRRVLLADWRSEHGFGEDPVRRCDYDLSGLRSADPGVGRPRVRRPPRPDLGHDRGVVGGHDPLPRPRLDDRLRPPRSARDHGRHPRRATSPRRCGRQRGAASRASARNGRPISTPAWCWAPSRAVDRLDRRAGPDPEGTDDPRLRTGPGPGALGLLAYAPFRAIPIAPIQNMAALKTADNFLTRWFGELPDIIDDPVQSANVRTRGWSTAIRGLQAEGCGRIVSWPTPAARSSASRPCATRVHGHQSRQADHPRRRAGSGLAHRGRSTGLPPGSRLLGDLSKLRPGSASGPTSGRPTTRRRPARSIRLPASRSPTDRTSTINRMSILEDHGSYWDNDEEFMIPLLQHIDTPSGAPETRGSSATGPWPPSGWRGGGAAWPFWPCGAGSPRWARPSRSESRRHWPLLGARPAPRARRGPGRLGRGLRGGWATVPGHEIIAGPLDGMSKVASWPGACRLNRRVGLGAAIDRGRLPGARPDRRRPLGSVGRQRRARAARKRVPGQVGRCRGGRRHVRRPDGRDRGDVRGDVRLSLAVGHATRRPGTASILVGEAGVEPAHRFRYQLLRLARLPFRHSPAATESSGAAEPGAAARRSGGLSRPRRLSAGSGAPDAPNATSRCGRRSGPAFGLARGGRPPRGRRRAWIRSMTSLKLPPSGLNSSLPAACRPRPWPAAGCCRPARRSCRAGRGPRAPACSSRGSRRTRAPGRRGLDRRRRRATSAPCRSVRAASTWAGPPSAEDRPPNGPKVRLRSAQGDEGGSGRERGRLARRAPDLGRNVDRRPAGGLEPDRPRPAEAGGGLRLPPERHLFAHPLDGLLGCLDGLIGNEAILRSLAMSMPWRKTKTAATIGQKSSRAATPIAAATRRPGPAEASQPSSSRQMAPATKPADRRPAPEGRPETRPQGADEHELPRRRRERSPPACPEL